jgi:hypothetical protein
MKENKLVQLNVRVPEKAKRVLALIAGMHGETMQDVLVQAVRIAMCAGDSGESARFRKTAKVVRDVMGDDASFNYPLAPENNALTTAAGDPSVVSPVGVVAQLVEHHNGIVATTQDGTEAASQPAACPPPSGSSFTPRARSTPPQHSRQRARTYSQQKSARACDRPT